MPTAGNQWVFTGAESPDANLGTLYKASSDDIWLEFNLGNTPEILAGETIVDASLHQSHGSGLTIGSATIDGYTVGAMYSGGSGDIEIGCTVTTSLGAIIYRVGILTVVD